MPSTDIRSLGTMEIVLLNERRAFGKGFFSRSHEELTAE